MIILYSSSLRLAVPLEILLRAELIRCVASTITLVNLVDGAVGDEM